MQVLGEKGMLRCDNVHIDSLTHFSANGPLAGGVVPSFADRCALKSIFSYFYASDFISYMRRLKTGQKSCPQCVSS